MEIAATPVNSQNVLEKLNTPSTVKGGGLSSLDQRDFLRLLTVQLSQQDPLEPVKNEAMLAQLAQFSALAATQSSSETLKEISAKLGEMPAVTQPAAG
jgi:flagellar basal-body rod modification protein FlgD